MLTAHRFGETEWLDLVDPTPAELNEATSRYALAGHSFDEAYRRAPRPTLHRYTEHAYLVAFSGSRSEIDMYLGTTWLVTIRRHDPAGEVWDPAEAITRFRRRGTGDASAGLLLTTILDQLVDGYFDTVDDLEDDVELLEDAIFSDDRDSAEVQQQMFTLRRRLLRVRRTFMPLRDVLGQISRGEVAWITGEALMIARDTYDKLLRVVDLVDDTRELLGNAVDAHLTVVSNQMNLVMKKLTAWGSILFGATLIAGIYGMNFEHMPELHWYVGYPMALGMMLVLSAVLYAMFRRRDWL